MTPATMSRHRSRVRSAMLWSYVLSGGKTAITLVVTFVLAAMLGPDAFGLLAMALVVVGLAEMLLQQGLLPAMVQRRELRPEHTDTAFWMVLAAGTLLAMFVLVSAPVWATVSGTAGLTELLRVLSVTVLLQALAVVPEALIRRRLQFRSLAVRHLTAAATGGAAAILAALAGWGVWALVVQQTVMSAVGLVVLYAATRYRPRPRFDRQAARDLYGFAGRSSVATLGLFAGSKADVILAGLFFGPVAVGLFRLARRLTDSVLEVTSRATQSVTLPALARLQDDPGAFRAAVWRLLRFTSLLSLPLLGFLLASGDLITDVLGEQWSGTGDAIRGLAVAQAAVAVSLLSGPILQAAGRPGTLAALTWGRSAALGAGLAGVGLLHQDSSPPTQVMAMTWIAVAVSFGGAAASLWAVGRLCRMRWTDFARAWWPALAGGALTVAAVSVVTAVVPSTSPWWGLAIAVTASGFILLGLLLLAEPTVRKATYGRLRRNGVQTESNVAAAGLGR